MTRKFYAAWRRLENQTKADSIPLRLSFCWCLLGAVLIFAGNAVGQTAFISDAWWTYQQDCNGDGLKAGTLPGNLARLNWDSDVTNCSGTLSLFEIVYTKPSASSTWTSIYTNPVHSVTGCRSIGISPHLDIAMGNGVTNDYKIEVYRSGHVTPDDVRSGTNDLDLKQHAEQLLSQDACLSDFFATAVALSGATGSESDDNSYATKEPGEPNHAGNIGGHSLWYSWTAPTNKSVTFDTLRSTFDTLLAVYTGNDVSNLTLVVSNDDIAGATNRASQVTFTPTTGVTYHIAVDGFGGATGNLTLNWNQTGANLADLVIWGPSVIPVILTRTFTNGDCEVVEGCEVVGTRRLLSWDTETRNIGSGDLVVGDPSTNSLFVWAQCHQHWHFEKFAQYNLLDSGGNVVSNAFGHKVGFCMEDYKQWSPTAKPLKYNCSNQGIQVGWADSYYGYHPELGFIGVACQYMDITDVPPGNYTLQLIVNPDGILPESNYENNTTLVPVTIPPVSCTNTPANDAFANAMLVTSVPFNAVEFNSCATKEPGEPTNIVDTPGGHSVWFQWTPTSNQTAVINTRRSDFDTVLAVYTGNSISSLTIVATNDDIVANSNLQSQVTFAAIGGTTYHIVVDGWGGAVGTVVLNVDPPANDDFTNASVLTGASGATNGYNVGGSKEALEPAHAGDVGGHSIWYRWTAPATGPVGFDTAGSDFDTTLAVYTGTVVTNLTTIASNDDDIGGAGLVTSRLWFKAISGTTYRIAVDGFGGAVGNVSLHWNMNSQLWISGMPGGPKVISLSGVEWQRYNLLESVDFIHWITNTTITMSGGLYHITNNDSGPHEFYKTSLVP
jgi:Lysyl oxidase